jgi:hypothetical protein
MKWLKERIVQLVRMAVQRPIRSQGLNSWCDNGCGVKKSGISIGFIWLSDSAWTVRCRRVVSWLQTIDWYV